MYAHKFLNELTNLNFLICVTRYFCTQGSDSNRLEKGKYDERSLKGYVVYISKDITSFYYFKCELVSKVPYHKRDKRWTPPTILNTRLTHRYIS